MKRWYSMSDSINAEETEVTPEWRREQLLTDKVSLAQGILFSVGITLVLIFEELQDKFEGILGSGAQRSFVSSV